MSHARSGFVDSLTAAVKDNPLAAALVGGGALWLLTGNGKMRKVTDTMTSVASAAAERSADAALSVASAFERDPPVSSNRDAASSASEAVAKTAHEARKGLDENVSNVRGNLGKLTDPLPTYESIQSSLTAAFERQPLLIGVAGAAIGATIAGAFAMSRIENETVGAVSEEFRSDLAARKDKVQQSLGEASDTLKAEFSDIGAEALDRAEKAGLDAMNAAREAVKP
jgi:hypothetical protein